VLAAHRARLRDAAGQPWVRGFAVLFLAQIVSEFAFQFALPFLPLYILELGVPDQARAGVWAGAMAGTFAIAQATMAPIWGVLADRYGRRIMIQRALFGGFVVMLGISQVTSPEQLLVLRVIQGGLTGVVAAMAVVVSLTVPRNHLATALGMMQAAMLAGASLGSIAGGAFADRFGMRAAFAATSLVFLATGLLVTLLVAEPPREPAPAAGGAGAGSVPIAAAGAADPSAADGARARLLSPELVAAIAVMAIIRIGSYAPAPVLPFFVQSMLDDPGRVASVVGLVLAATGVASTVAALAVGRVADRYGARATLVTCLLAAAALCPLHALVGTIGQLLAIRTAFGLALGGMMPAVQALVTDRTPANRRGAAFGVLATAQAIGNGGGPVAGALIAATMGVPAVFVLSAPVFLVGAALVARLPGRGR
jgi:DHA1 family multidrug resistance protein-like MFS transporter